MNKGLLGVDFKKPLSGLKDFFYSLRSFIGVNATVPVHYMLAESAEANVDVAILPRGTGAFLLSLPDGVATIGGNKRGTRAVDLQLTGSRGTAAQVASGTESFVVGNSNIASGAQSIAIGIGNSSTGIASFAAGSLGTASGPYSFTLCRYGFTNARSSSYAYGTEGSAAAGRFQASGIGLVATSTGTTPVVATATAAAASTTNQLTLQNNSAAYMYGSVMARDTVTNDTAWWEFFVLIKRGAAAANTSIVGTPTITKVFSDAAAATWIIDVTADTTNGALAVTVTGAGANAIRWHARLDGNEVA